MPEASSVFPDVYPLTITDWRTAQGNLHDPFSLLALLERAKSSISNAWIALATEEDILAQWEALSKLRTQGHDLPLLGVPFAVKDNIDVAGFCTTAACPSFGTTPVEQDATVVARLKRKGAVVIGKTNLDQFATGLSGCRSSYGVVANAFDPNHVSGGSSSGSGVVVAQGLVPFALGTDTAGSGRVPAGFNNVIGLKPTKGALSTCGVLPACRSLDSVSVFSLNLPDAELVLRLAEGYDERDCYSRTRQHDCSGNMVDSLHLQPKIAVCSSPNWFGDLEHASAYEAAISKARELGWALQPVDFAPLFALASLLYDGPWVAERYAAIEGFLRSSAEKEMDPVVRSIIQGAKRYSAVDTFNGAYTQQQLSRQIKNAFGRYDAIMVPTTPTFPTMQQMKEEPIVANSRLGTYTNFVNLMDWTALAIPAGFRADGLPFGITLIGGTWGEPRLFDLGYTWLSEARLLGATKALRQEDDLAPPAVHIRSVAVAVVGAHLSGYPLNSDLTSRGAKLSLEAHTSNHYQLWALHSASSRVAKPGLRRVAEGGSSIEIEVWEIPIQDLGSFLLTIPHPLGLGSVELEGGRWVQGFICEPVGFEGAVDITEYGGWRAYTQK